MKKILTPLSSLVVALLFITSFISCKKDDNTDDPDDMEGYSGYIYTSTNSSEGNGIIVLGRKSDGSVTELPNSPISTGDLGDAMEGDFDTEYALKIIGDYLLAVNAGENPVNSSISVFKINRTDGSLTQVDQNPSTPEIDNMDSHGVRSVSIAAHESGGTTWIVVANQYANPNYQGSPAEDFGMVESTDLRNLAVFTFDQSTGVLLFNSIGATYTDGTNGGPAATEFNSSGTKLAVSTWGVPHFAVDDPDLSLQKPGRLYTYDFASGMLTQSGLYEEEGVSGNIGISWSPNDAYVYMTNFNLHSSKEDNSVTVHDGNTASKVQNFPTGPRNDEACWTLVSTDKQHLFTASFSSNIVSVFNIGSDGLLSKSLDPNYFERSGGLPPGDTKDMYMTPDGYLYVSGAFHTHTLTTFSVGANGALSEVSGSPYPVPSSFWMIGAQQAYLGLTGFEK
jgi:6-phosphogluconolactonase (cycloisomerase 2 family)